MRDAVRGVEAKAASHREARAARARTIAELDVPDPAAIASADTKWHGWSDIELRRIQAERARLEVEAESRRAAARRAFGRGQALDRLSVMLADEQRRKRARRDEF